MFHGHVSAHFLRLRFLRMSIKQARIQKFMKELDPVHVEHQLKVNMHVLEILYPDKLWVYKGK